MPDHLPLLNRQHLLPLLHDRSSSVSPPRDELSLVSPNLFMKKRCRQKTARKSADLMATAVPLAATQAASPKAGVAVSGTDPQIRQEPRSAGTSQRSSNVPVRLDASIRAEVAERFAQVVTDEYAIRTRESNGRGNPGQTQSEGLRWHHITVPVRQHFAGRCSRRRG